MSVKIIRQTGHGCLAALLLSLNPALSLASEQDKVWFVTASFGNTEAANVYTFDYANGRASFDDEGSTRSMEVGRHINRHFDVQAGYHDFGRYAGGSSLCPLGFVCPAVIRPFVATITGLSVSVTGALPLTDNFSLYAEIGRLHWMLDAPIENTVFHIKDADGSSIYGVGVRYRFSPVWSLQLEKREYGFLDADGTSLGITWHF